MKIEVTINSDRSIAAKLPSGRVIEADSDTTVAETFIEFVEFCFDEEIPLEEHVCDDYCHLCEGS